MAGDASSRSYFGEAALIDLDDLEHNTRDGLHIASLAGAWIVAVSGFGGMRDRRHTRCGAGSRSR
jgi:trehalose/maltose hydrolase-like predicted phosphorylase